MVSKKNKLTELAEKNKNSVRKNELLNDIAELLLSKNIDPKDIG